MTQEKPSEADVLNWAARFVSWSPREPLARGLVGPYSKVRGRRLLEGSEHAWRGVLLVDGKPWAQPLVDAWLTQVTDVLGTRLLRVWRAWTPTTFSTREAGAAAPRGMPVCLLVPDGPVLAQTVHELSSRVVEVQGGPRRHHFARAYDAETLFAVAWFDVHFDAGMDLLRSRGRRDLEVAVEERLSAVRALLLDDLCGARDDLDHVDVAAGTVHAAREFGDVDVLDVLHLLAVQASNAFNHEGDHIHAGGSEAARWVAPRHVHAAFDARGYAKPMARRLVDRTASASWSGRLDKALANFDIDGLPLLHDQVEFIRDVFHAYFES
jgi:hypothetical protein